MRLIVSFLCLFCFPQMVIALDQSQKFGNLDLALGFPEGIGLDFGYRYNSFLSFHAFYNIPTVLQVKTQVKSRKLLERDGLIIRSPNFDLPFQVQFGPHQGAGASYYPFEAAFYLMLAWEFRLIEIQSEAQSQLEVIGSQNRAMTHTRFRAEASTRTEQSLLRICIGYQWQLGDSGFSLSFFSGWLQPYQAHSTAISRVKVQNPEASHPYDVNARNLEQAEAEQAQMIEQRLRQELKKLENLGLPVFGLSFGTSL